MQLRKQISCPAIAISFIIACLMLLSGGLLDAASAAICKDSAGANVQGFTVQIIYCVRATITDALSGTNNSGILTIQNGGFLGQIITLLAPYKWAAITLTLSLYGVKLMTLDTEELLKESATLIFKIALVLFLIASLNSTSFYNSATGAGLYGALADAAGELVSMVAGGFDKLTCTPPPLPAGVNQGEYKVWQEFDCLFSNMFNFKADVVDDPTIVLVGVLGFIGAAMFSGGLGVVVVMMVVSLFVLILQTLAKAVYCLLLAYFVLALLILMGPLIIPALLFNNRFTQEIFKKWVALLASVIIEPLFIVGFLSFFIIVEDQFVDGNLATCNTPATQSQMCYNTANDYEACQGQSRMGVCSIKQMMTICQTVGCLKLVPVWTPTFNVQFTANCNNDFGFNVVCDGEQVITTLVNWTTDIVQAIGKAIFNMIRIPKLVNLSLMSIFISFLTFFIVTCVLKDLLKVAPKMAQEMTMGVGAGIFQLAQVPLEKTMDHAMASANSRMKWAAGQAKKTAGHNPMKNLKSLPGIAGKGMQGAASGLMRSLIK